MTLQSTIESAADQTRRGHLVAALLRFGVAEAGTYLQRQFTPYPFHITRPFSIPEDPDGMVTLYLQSCSGGLYGDDDLSLKVELCDGAHAHVTTQASTVVHAARGGVSRLHTDLSVGNGAFLEYCPDPSILMPSAVLHTTVRATLTEDGYLFATDACLTHDPNSADTCFGEIFSDISLEDSDGRPILTDRQLVSGPNWGRRMGQFKCFGSAIVRPNARFPETQLSLQEALNQVPEVYGGVNAFTDRRVILVRFLAPDGVALTKMLNALWIAARTSQVGRAPTKRRK